MSNLKAFDGKEFQKRLLAIAGGDNQKEIAEKIGRTGTDISRWCHNNKEPNVTDLLNIAAVYNCSIDYLLGVDDLPSSHTSGMLPPETVCRMIMQLYGYAQAIEMHGTISKPTYVLSFLDPSCLNPNPTSSIEIELWKNITIVWDFLKNYTKVQATDMDADIMKSACESIISTVIKNVEEKAKHFEEIPF